jgi:hypothetical protein
MHDCKDGANDSGEEWCGVLGDTSDLPHLGREGSGEDIAGGGYVGRQFIHVEARGRNVLSIGFDCGAVDDGMA